MSFHEHFEINYEAVRKLVLDRIHIFLRDHRTAGKQYVYDEWHSEFGVIFLEAAKIYVPYYERITNPTRQDILKDMSRTVVVHARSNMRDTLDFKRTLVRKVMEDHRHFLREMYAETWNAAVRIQRQFRRCDSDPSFKICRNRLMREWGELNGACDTKKSEIVISIST